MLRFSVFLQDKRTRIRKRERKRERINLWCEVYVKTLNVILLVFWCILKGLFSSLHGIKMRPCTMDTEANTGAAIPTLADLLNDFSLDRETEQLLKEIRAEIERAESSFWDLPDSMYKVHSKDKKLGLEDRFSESIVEEEKRLIKQEGVYQPAKSLKSNTGGGSFC